MPWNPSLISYRNWLSNPNASVGNGLPKKERSRLRSEKRRALQSFCLKDNQLYRKAEKSFGDRVVATTYDAAHHIIQAHEVIGHTGTRKTHQKLMETVFDISQDDVEELIPGYNSFATLD